MNIFNLAKNELFLEDLKKKVAKSYWNHIHEVYVTQIHHDTWFLTQFLMKMPHLLLKQWFLLFSKINISLGFWRSYWNSMTSFFYINDYNKCPFSGKKDEKCIFRKSYFHQIQPRHRIEGKKRCWVVRVVESYLEMW